MEFFWKQYTDSEKLIHQNTPNLIYKLIRIESQVN